VAVLFGGPSRHADAELESEAAAVGITEIEGAVLEAETFQFVSRGWGGKGFRRGDGSVRRVHTGADGEGREEKIERGFHGEFLSALFWDLSGPENI
jgi:hypothetical protein